MVRPASLEMRIVADATAVNVTPSGELDLSNVGELRTTLWALISDGRRRLVLDLGELDFIDTSGLHLVLDLVRHCAREGVALEVARGRYPIRRAFELAGLERVVPFIGD